MDTRDATELLHDAVPAGSGTWMDLGSGDGTFTKALVARLGPQSRILAVDRDRRAVAALERWAKREAPNVRATIGDFTAALDLPWLDPGSADGLLFANALHFVRDPGVVLGRLVGWLGPAGRVVVVEYDRRAANPWVPFPIPPARLEAIAAAAGLPAPVLRARRPSAFGGDLYVATMDRAGAAT
jgi:trans-aconitate methyltransferase